MAGLSAPEVAVRDFLPHILPVIVGLALFLPFFTGLAPFVTVQGVVVGGIVVGYLASSLIRSVSDAFFRRLPRLGRELERCERRRRWLQANWDYSMLSVHMTKDEADHVETVGSYVLLDRALVLCLGAYAIVNAAWLAVGLSGRDGVSAASLVPRLWEIRTPMLGGWELPTLLCIAVALLLMRYAAADSLRLYMHLYLVDGVYDTLAVKHQAAHRDIARRIWGRVLRQGRTAANVVVTLTEAGATRAAQTDADGFFHFEGVPSQGTLSVDGVQVTVGSTQPSKVVFRL